MKNNITAAWKFILLYYSKPTPTFGLIYFKTIKVYHKLTLYFRVGRYQDIGNNKDR